MSTEENIQPPPPPVLQPHSGSSEAHLTTTRVRARPDPFLVVCRCFSFVTAMAAILCIFVNVLSAIRSFRNGSDVFDGIYRCYAVVVAVLVVVAETEWRFITQYWKILKYWTGRGMLQIFAAVMTRAYPDYFGQRQQLVVLQNLSGYLLLACGLVYLISGILCIGAVQRCRQKQEHSREQAVKDIQDLERRREELEALLIVDRV
ncbi:hypothetical protein Leryth_014142 [Lithospermum erythrorhizon]|nr:hypothetical protein Leryth_014142 [Lithospermum erythrorhizon]